MLLHMRWDLHEMWRTGIVFINDGVIQENTTPQEFFENPKNERLREFLSKMI